jgi:hypothetical protein
MQPLYPRWPEIRYDVVKWEWFDEDNKSMLLAKLYAKTNYNGQDYVAFTEEYPADTEFDEEDRNDLKLYLQTLFVGVV